MKNILLTGGSKGLGLEIIKTLLKDENNIIYVVNRTKSEILHQLIEENPARIKFSSFDLSNSEDVKKEIFETFMSFDIPISAFINNAAYAYDDIITNLNVNQLEKMYRVNVFSPMNIVKYDMF